MAILSNDHVCGYPNCIKRKHGVSIFCYEHYKTVGYTEYNDIVQKEYWDNAPNSKHALKEIAFRLGEI